MKPTVTQITTKYAIFRKGVAFRTEEYALQDHIYDTYSKAMVALSDLQADLSMDLKNKIEVRVVEGTVDEHLFGKNPLAWYYE